MSVSFDSNLIVHGRKLVIGLPLSRVLQGHFTRIGVEMAKSKKVVRREWTKEDIRQMKTMARAKAGVTKIAKSLKRTPGATSVMATKLGVSLSMRA